MDLLRDGLGRCPWWLCRMVYLTSCICKAWKLFVEASVGEGKKRRGGDTFKKEGHTITPKRDIPAQSRQFCQESQPMSFFSRDLRIAGLVECSQPSHATNVFFLPPPPFSTTQPRRPLLDPFFSIPFQVVRKVCAKTPCTDISDAYWPQKRSFVNDYHRGTKCAY